MATGELVLFWEIWEERPHESWLSGKPIFQFDPWCFAHVLNKKTYPEFRLRKENIIILTREEHKLLDQGTDREREEYAKKNQPLRRSWSEIEVVKDGLRFNNL